MSSLDWLRPAAPEPVLACSLDDAGLRWAALDGLLAPAGPGGLAATDLLAGPTGRADALAPGLPPGVALARASAVWVHTGRHRPTVTEVLVPRGRRWHAPHLRVHTQGIDPGDLVRVGAALVTSPVRTAADVARWTPCPAATAQLADLLATGVDPAEVTDHLEHHRHEPHTRRARELLAAVSARPRAPSGPR
ncbi:hypothetical protein [Georgenia faecalis]|uniref:AbiEi antitoxin C-terminal domain-containing protein n=1 Tax=Georgenia faecalis TaxID=2483799 RepID=A0ABV9DAW2_9MICO|nr:hypothetical protein [Georgenia faecalis]